MEKKTFFFVHVFHTSLSSYFLSLNNKSFCWEFLKIPKITFLDQNNFSNV